MSESASPITFPDSDWETAEPENVGIDRDVWDAWISEQQPIGASVAGERHPDREWGAVVVHGGRVVGKWGD